MTLATMIAAFERLAPKPLSSMTQAERDEWQALPYGLRSMTPVSLCVPELESEPTPDLTELNAIVAFLRSCDTTSNTSHRQRERALDAILRSRLAADEGGPPPVAERDLDLGEYTIRTYSNHTFDYAAPRASDVHYVDMVAGLSTEPRYNGQAPRHYSVAEHLVLASRVAEVLEPMASREALFAVLMHDAAEAYCKDLPGPLKRLIGEPYRQIERAVEAVIFERFGVVFEPHRQLVKECDRLSYLIERAVLFGWAEVDLPGELGARVREAQREAEEGLYASALARALPWPAGPKIVPAQAFSLRFEMLTRRAA